MRPHFLDYKLGVENGLDILPDLVKEHPSTRILMITAHGSIELALNAIHAGVSGFITKPFEEDKVEEEINRALRIRAHDVTGRVCDVPSGIIGSSPAVARIHDQINKMKDVATTVLVVGESGTGKELIARALHNLSKRKDECFEAVNCAAIPETLLEAELFGYKRGAFTDAKTDRKGLFETCSKGTLFLDEIGELPFQLQSKLLRVVQEKIVTPLGSSTSVKVDTRVVVATNRNLNFLVKEGKFRKDLYYRLSILQIESPPLRDRAEDIPELTKYFVESISRSLGRMVRAPSAEVMTRLESYEWPGNVRELQNSLERAIVLSENGELSISDIFSNVEVGNSSNDQGFEEISCVKPLTDAKDEFEKRYLERLLRSTKGNVSQASRVAGRIRTDMYRLFAKYTLDPNDYKPY
ncbi:MAG: sigma-54 dependent transcriptional regulator [Bdellovibrionota bacterium]